MVYLKTNIHKDLYEELASKDSQELNDYGFEYLYNKKYISTDKEYKGCFLRKINDKYEIIYQTEKQEVYVR